ncbi:MAG: Rrf2 family transcriptional regulator [Lachnospiraceae bacterium]|jgi:Rrf2 family protein|nr:Rrf2 family transcriptional regulator [Lachnospiraceae bacterium]MCR5345577.1 Rrf2 family transcriptional regulator [Lachnospiraceae bacterium]
MKLSTKGRYGLRAFVDIAIYSEKEPVSLAEVAKRQDISISYLEQLMTKLKKANLVESVRGASGGYVLTRKPEEISVGDVLRALEGDLSPVECATEEESCEHSCGATGHCTTRLVWKKINDSVNDTINNIFISELVNDSRNVGEE